MPAQETGTNVLRFGLFELDLRQSQLRKQGVRVKLQDQPLKVLLLLLENPGEIVGREQLRLRIWPADTFVEFDQGLYSAMSRLRDALGDDAESPRFIETVARRGYRFIAPVTPAAPRAVRESSEPPGPARVRLPRVAVALVAGLLAGALLLGLALAFDVARAREWLHVRTHPVRSIAVLPLENLSGDPEQEYFAEGMTDELITSLAKIGDFRVVSRTSVMRYKKTSKPVAEVGRELNVDAVVEGTVERAADHVRIRVQLVHADTDRNLWAQTYDRQLRDTLLLESQAAGDIVREIRRSLTPPQEKRLAAARPVDPGAHEAYLKGLYFSNKHSVRHFPKAIAYFEQAVARDPGYAIAYAGLSDAYLGQGYSGSAAQAIREKATAAAVKAVELDPALSEAHISMGGVREFFDQDWPAADREYRLAVELNDNSAVAHQDAAMFLVFHDRMDEALAQNERAQELDPLSAWVRSTYCINLMLVRRYDRARQKCQEALELDPDYYHAHCHLAQIEESAGNDDRAFAEFETCAVAAGEPAVRLAAMRQAYRARGVRGLWRKRLELILERDVANQDTYYDTEDAYAVAALYARLGEKERALGCLEEARNERALLFEWVKFDPAFDGMRSEPAFMAFLRRAGLG